MKSLLILSVGLVLSACAPQPVPTFVENPFDEEFIADVRSPHDEQDLRELLLTLPVWDVPPERILPWISEYGTVSGGTLQVQGDGAQDTLRLRKLPTPNHYELFVGNEEWPEGGLSYYTLERLSNRSPKGWKVLSRR